MSPIILFKQPLHCKGSLIDSPYAHAPGVARHDLHTYTHAETYNTHMASPMPTYATPFPPPPPPPIRPDEETKVYSDRRLGETNGQPERHRRKIGKNCTKRGLIAMVPYEAGAWGYLVDDGKTQDGYGKDQWVRANALIKDEYKFRETKGQHEVVKKGGPPSLMMQPPPNRGRYGQK